MGWLLSLLSGGLIGQIADPLLKAQQAQLTADTSDKKIAADYAVKKLEDDADARATAKQIRLATAGYWEMRVLTALIALPFIVHLWLVALDTCFKFGWRIDAFPAPFDQWEGAILLSFFGVSVIGTGIHAVAGAVAFKGRNTPQSKG